MKNFALFRISWSRNLAAASFTVLLALLLPVVVFADTLAADADFVTPSNQTSLYLGSVAPGAVLNPQVSFTLVCAGKQHVDEGQTVNLTFSLAGSTVPAGGSLSATNALIGPIPASWPDDTTGGGSTNCPSPFPTLDDNGNSTVTITAPTTPGPYTYLVKYNNSLTPAGNGDPQSITSLTPTITYTLNVVANTPPTINVNDVTVEGNTTGGWTLAFGAIGTASDAEDGTPSVSCTPAIGSVLPLGPNLVSCTATDSGGLTASDSGTVTVEDTTPPSIICPADFDGTVGQPVSLGSPVVSDIVDPSPGVTNDAPASFPPGMTNVMWTATDGSGNTASCTQKVTLTYNFTGFFRPIENVPTMNVAKAGSAIPVKFSLDGFYGLNIFPSGYPKTTVMSCNSSSVLETVDETMTAGGSSLSYDASADQYVYVWKTNKAWGGTCRKLQVMLDDGTTHVSYFNFR